LLLYLDGASIGYLTTVNSESASGQAVPVTVSRRLTPAAGSRQFSIGAIVSGSSGNVVAGPGGVGQQVPAYIRVCRA